MFRVKYEFNNSSNNKWAFRSEYVGSPTCGVIHRM